MSPVRIVEEKLVDAAGLNARARVKEELPKGMNEGIGLDQAGSKGLKQGERWVTKGWELGPEGGARHCAVHCGTDIVLVHCGTVLVHYGTVAGAQWRVHCVGQ